MKRLLSLFIWLWVPFFVHAQTGSINVSVIRSKVTDSTTVVEPSGYKNLWYSNQSGYWTYTDGTGRHRLVPGAGSVADGDKGDITVSGSGATWTIDNTVVTYAKFQDVAGLSVVGRASNSSGVTAAITAGSDYNILRRSGTSIGFGAVDLSQSGTVGASVLGVANGGTAIASYAVGDLIYASGSTTLSKLADVAAGSYLRSGGVTTAPVWSTLVLPNSATANRVVYATSTNTYGESANLTFTGSVLTLAGQQLITATNPSATALTLATTGTAITNSTAFMVITGSHTLRSNSGDLGYIIRNQGGLTTGGTNQEMIVYDGRGTFTANHTGAVLRYAHFNPTIAGTQTASLTVKSWEHTVGFVQWASVLSPSQITSNQTDYNPTGFTSSGAPYGASRLRINSDAARSIFSLGSTGGNVDGRQLQIENTGSYIITLVADDGSTGTAALRFATTYALLPGQAIELEYDGTSSRWRIQGNTTFTSALPGLVPSSGGGTTNFLRADGTWAAPSGGISGTLGTVDNAATRADGTGGSTAQGSDLLISDAADLTLGITASTTGTTRTVLAAGTSSNIVLALSSKGSSSVSITSNSNTWLINGANVYNNTGVSNFAGDNDGVFLKSFDASGVTGDVTVSTGSSSTDNSGNIFLSIGSASGTRGNLSIFDSTGSFGSGQRVIFIADRTAAPSGTPSGGGILYVESGALKFKGSSGTVTTVAVP